VDKLGPKILLVDDNLALLKIHQLQLKLDGFEVITARDGFEGLRKAEIEKPIIIILDLQMPRVDGFELLRELKKSTSLSKVVKIVLSEYDQPAIIENCLGLGAAQYLIKSQTTPEELSYAIDRVIHKFRIN
jgi:two-component system, OmpR family, alkaline phosphatase synthesis response regulator PhoP